MIAYVDSSVVLRLILGQTGRLTKWSSIERGIASALIEVECLRTLDRFRLAHGVSDKDHTRRRAAVYAIIEELEIVEVTASVLSRAAQPMPTALGTLDAIHLATALLWRDHSQDSLVMTTHDAALARAAEAFGFSTLGTES